MGAGDDGCAPVAVPAKLLMLATAAVSTLVSFTGGFVMWLDVQAILVDTVRETSAVDAASIARKLNGSYGDVYDYNAALRALVTDYQPLGESVRKFVDFFETDSFARVNSSANLYSIVIAVIPPHFNETANDTYLYHGVWYDPLADGTREYVITNFTPSMYGRYQCSNGQPYCQEVYSVDRITGKPVQWVYSWRPTWMSVITPEGPWGRALEGWETHGASWWRRPALWYASDGTPYSYATYQYVLPKTAPGDTRFFADKLVIISTYFTFYPWDGYMSDQATQATAVALYLNAGLDSEVIATNTGQALMKRGCARTSSALTTASKCGMLLRNMSSNIQVAAQRMNNTPEGAFVTSGLPDGEHWLRLTMIAPKQKETDEMATSFLLWMRPVSSLADEVDRTLYLFLAFVGLVFGFDLVILWVEIVLMAKPLGRLEFAMRPLETMDLDLADSRASAVLGSCTVTEVRVLTRSFRHALQALAEYRRFIPQTILVAEIEDSAETVAGTGEARTRTESGCNTEMLGRDASSRMSDVTSASTQAVVTPNRTRRKGVMELHDFRSKKASVLLCSCPFEPQLGGTQQRIAARFVSAALTGAGGAGGVTASTATCGDRLELLISWNLLRPHAGHAQRACEAALDVQRALVGSFASPSFAVCTGFVHYGNVGNELQRSVALMGEPVSQAASLTRLGSVLEARVLCEGRTREFTFSTVATRVIDAVRDKAGEEYLIYEVLSMDVSKIDRQDMFIRAFLSLRSGNYTDAQTNLEQHLEENGPDRQAIRLYRLSLVLERAGVQDVSFCRLEKGTWECPEQVTKDSPPLPDSVLRFMDQQRGSVATEPPPGLSPVEGAKRSSQCDADVLKDQIRQAYANMPGGDSDSAPNRPPNVFEDARAKQYHRSDRNLGRGAFGEVWLGMGTDGAMVAVKTIRLRRDGADGPPSGTREDPAATAAMVEDVEEADPWTISGVSSVEGSSRDPAQVFQTFSQPGQTLARRQVAELVQEVTLMISLKHENVVQFLGCGVQNAYVLIVMEYLPGGSLQLLLRQFSGRIPPPCVKRYMKDIATGLRFMHKNRIVHRDLKPANVLLTVEGQCKLADFGASAELKAAAAGSEEEFPVGTPLYMPPEQTRGQATTLSDMWSYGLILCELLTGRVPWGDVGNQMAFMTRLGADDSMVPRIPDAVTGDARDVAAMCLRREQLQRPSARKVLEHKYLV
eukprot:TRINITY_DN5432_c3_g1_i1.p1 TRINITY_DN5432_c3_g1~~TRINITY_DN5432_c3_g1_i1.p1  ORF type:complete len:1205 (+),score=334.76 TRINITY_DN5432_c3_g1_i1:56-3670(+)